MQVIFLCILKWIGIIIAVLLGLLLLLCVSIVFVPIRYRIEGCYGEKKEYAFCVHWLLYLISVRKRRNSDKMWLCICGIPVKKLMDFGDEVSKPSEKETSEKEILEKGLSEKELSGKEGYKKDKKKDKKKDQKDNRKKIKKKTKKEKKKADKKTNKGKKLKEKHFSFSKISSIIKFIREKATKDVIKMLRGELFGVIKHILPLHIKGYIRFGFTDPAVTGIAVGIISLFPVAYQKGFQVLPDFEEQVFEAEGMGKGRIRIFYLLRAGGRIYFNKKVRKLIKRYEKLKEELSNGR